MKSCSFLTSALDVVSGQRHAPAALYPREWNPGTHCVGDWVGHRAGLNIEARGKILCFCRESNLGRPVCDQTLYCLSYPRLFIKSKAVPLHAMEALGGEDV
jgi:hypothetical protein